MTAVRNYHELALAIAARREALGMTQPELAAAAGVSPMFVQRFEAGLAFFHPATLAPTLAALRLRLIVRETRAAA